MAKGFDLLAGSILLEMKENQTVSHEINLVAVLPFKKHGFDTTSRWQPLHQLLLDRADEIVNPWWSPQGSALWWRCRGGQRPLGLWSPW